MVERNSIDPTSRQWLLGLIKPVTSVSRTLVDLGWTLKVIVIEGVYFFEGGPSGLPSTVGLSQNNNRPEIRGLGFRLKTTHFDKTCRFRSVHFQVEEGLDLEPTR